MTDQKTPQQTSNVNYQQPLEEETTFIDILAVIVKKKGLILLITSIFTILSFCYYSFATPIYRTNISFLPPAQEIYLSKIDPNIFTRAIDTSLEEEKKKDKNLGSSTNIFDTLTSDNFLYRQFLTKVQSFSLQKEVLNKKKFLEGFFGNSLDPEILNQKLISLHNKISLKIKLVQKYSKKTIELDKPAHLEMEGPNPVVMAEFLNTLADSAKTTTIKETQYALQALIDNRLKIAIRHKELLRFKAHKDRLKKIKVLSDSLKIAQNLNIKNNNFHLLEKNERSGKNELSYQKGLMKLFENGFIPQWFLYGEKALTEEIKILKSRTNEDSYIANLVVLEDQIKQLQAFDASKLVPTIVLIEQPSIPPIKPVNLKVEKVFSLGIGLGLFLGIIAAFLSHSMGILRNKNN